MVSFSQEKLDEYLRDPDLFEHELESLENASSLSLDKSWEGIHFLLTGAKLGSGTPPLSLVIYSEQFFDEEQDLGMGPASYLTPAQVRTVSEILLAWDEQELRARFDPVRMNQAEVYPFGWDQEPEEQFAYLRDNFIDLKKFYADAASRGAAIASYIG